MRAKVKILPRAEKDLLALPEKLQDEILNKLELLETSPEMGTTMERAYEGFRYLLAGKGTCRIIYKVKNQKSVEVCYLRHCRRQLSLHLLQ